MYYVYELLFENGERYVGCTNNIRRRKDQHNENTRKKKSKLGKYLNKHYPGSQLEESDFNILASYENRAKALEHEREYAKTLNGNTVLLNDNYSKNCSRKGKRNNVPVKKYCLVDYLDHTTTIVENLRKYCIENGLNYKNIQGTTSKSHTCNGRYKAFLLEDWEKIEDKDYYVSGDFAKDITKKHIKAVVENHVKEYVVLTPQGEKVKVRNLSQYAREVGVNEGNLHGSYASNKPAQGYKVIERI